MTRAARFQKFYAWHRRLGLFLALHLFLLIITGTLLVFHQDTAKEPDHGETSSTAGQISLSKAIGMALALQPEARVLAIGFDETKDSRVVVRLSPNGSPSFKGSQKITVDRQTAGLVEDHPNSGFWDYVLRIHREFLLGYYGKLYVGIIGALFTLSLLSGLFIYIPLMKRRGFGTLRRARREWLMSDLHSLIGSVGFAWFLLMAATGTLLGTSDPLLKLYQFRELKQLQVQYPVVRSGLSTALDAFEASFRTSEPHQAISLIIFPGSEYSLPGSFLAVIHGREGFDKYVNEILVLDGQDGHLIERKSLPTYIKALILSEPLHFGNYGGIALQVLWIILGVIALILSTTGPYLWFLKRKRQLRNDQQANRHLSSHAGTHADSESAGTVRA